MRNEVIENTLQLLTTYARNAQVNGDGAMQSYYTGVVVGAMCICLELQIPRDKINDALQRAHGE